MQANSTDKALVDGCAINDRRAQEELYRRFYESMMSLCLRYTKNRQDALDALNNGFLKVFQHVHEFNPGVATLYTWIRKIIINSTIDHLRHTHRFQCHVELGCTEEPAVEDYIFSKMNAGELLKLIQQLPPATQAVFNLYVIDGYNHREISTIMGIREGTSKWHLSEARRLLQQLLEKEIKL